MRLPVILLAACAGSGEPSYGDPLDDPQLPPRGFADLADWLAAGHYQAWHCEAAAHPPRPGSGHGPNRICSNDALATAPDDVTPFPAGAVAVKEIFDRDGRLVVHAVYRKLETGRWYWYEGDGDDVAANGEDEPTCTGCHAGAPRDFVFTVVR
ncbi:MAG TPA: hypothetical protein VFQ53_34385 [Kofleriaceae bacterium]|nr:hypothetical protein [Kofleriaceae bacterium]